MRRLGLAPKIVDFARELPLISDWLKTVEERWNLYSGTADPTTAEVPKSQWVLYKNTTSGEVRVWVNDNGTLKKSAAFT